MGSYHRTQLLLEEWQYRALKGLADNKGISLSDMVRRILAREFRSDGKRRKGLRAIAGIGRDPGARGRDHDRWLYGRGRPGA